jgi:O-antigen ligase
MKRFLIFLILMQFVTQTFSLDLSIVRGLNLKNAMIYAAFVTLLIRMAMDGRFRIDLPGLQGSFFTLIAYGIVSYLVMIFVAKPQDYDPITAAIFLKSSLIDYLIVFLVFFYGVKTLKDSLDVTKALVLGMVFANLVTVLDVTGVLGLNIIPVRDGAEAGRVQGALGEANQYAAIIVMLLPATIAYAITTRGGQRLFWMGSSFLAVTALLMTISRGAMVGIVIGAMVGGYLLRPFISPAKVAKWTGVALVVLAFGLILLSASYGQLIYERLIASTFHSDGVDATSGRNLIWAAAIGTMADAPWTFITGYGFSAYFFMPFEYGTHNDFLYLWFDLGLPGVLSFIAIHLQAVGTARHAALVAPSELRPFLVAFVIGWIAVCVSVFFVNLIEPYIYVWAYLGVSMRMAVCAPGPRTESEGVSAVVSSGGMTPVAAAFGWVANTRSLPGSRGGISPAAARNSNLL